MGRKRHIVVDTQGFLMRVVVHPAHLEDRDGALLLAPKLIHHFDRLKLLWADRAYNGDIKYWLLKHMKVTLQLPKPISQPDGHKLYPRRWVVERTFAWLSRYRRLHVELELLPSVSEAFVYVASINLLLHRLAP